MNKYKAEGLKKAGDILSRAVRVNAGLAPKSKGWKGEPVRHGLASKGVETSSKRKPHVNIHDRENFRRALRAELEAISMYEKIAEETDDERVKEIFTHIANEEKHHLAEFGTGLRMVDEEQLEMDEKAINEILNEIENKDEFERKIQCVNRRVNRRIRARMQRDNRRRKP